MQRRSAGEGNISPYSRGGWRGSVQVHGKRKYVYGKTRKEVADKLQALRERVARGESIRTDRISVAAFLERWIDEAVRPSRRTRTTEHYDYARRRLITPYIGKARIDRLTALDIQKMLTHLAEAGKSPRQQQTAHMTLRCALEQAVEWGMIPANPAVKVKRPRVAEVEMRALTLDEVGRLLDEAAKDPYEALIHVLVFCGLRWGEAAGLQWGDIDFQREMLSVRRAVEETNEGVTIGEVKSRAARRSVALPQPVVDALKRDRDRLAGTPHPRLLVFKDAKGGPLRRGNFGRRHWRPMREAAGLNDVRLHDLRHTAATLALLAGSDPKTLQSRLGHSSAAFTLQRYGHVLEDAQRTVADRLSKLVKR